jgi:NADH dehydrogenase FAD-containing subunit
MRVLDPQNKPLENVYALGDCANILDYNLPQTAQVAKQKGIYLAKQLNTMADNLDKPLDREKLKPFSYADMGSMAYIGGWRAVANLKSAQSQSQLTGPFAWFLWRSAYMTMTVSWKNKVLIPMYWFLTWAFGRDISRIK